MATYAPIVTFEEIDRLRPTLGKIVCTSGGFDPIHPSCVLESKQYGDTLVVIVNGDSFLRNKKGKAFQDLQTRCQIVACLREVDYVVPFEIENDQTVCEALRRLRESSAPEHFAIFHASVVEELPTESVMNIYHVSRDNLYQIRKRMKSAFAKLPVQALGVF